MRTAAIALVAVMAVACSKKQDATGSSSGGAAAAVKLPASRAAAVGDFPDNALLAYVPADAPYALATFKPISPEYIDKVMSTFGPAVKAAMEVQSTEMVKLRAITDEIGTFSVQRFEELGFSAKARLVVYGIGLYPAMRVEIKDGDKVFAFVQRVAKRMQVDLPAPTEKNGHRYWTFSEQKDGLVLSLDKDQVVAAIVPADKLTEMVPVVLGDQKPAKAATTAMFRDLAQRDGFTGQGVGYVDTARVIAASLQLAGTDRPSDACVAAIQLAAMQVPRVAFGYDDMTATHIGFGAVVELAPDVQTAIATMTAKIPGVGRLVAHQPVFGMAIAVDVDRMKALAPKLALALRGLGAACSIDAFSSAADSIDRTAAKPLPPFLAGSTGGVIAVDDLKMSGGMPEKLDAYGIFHVGDAGPLLELAANEIPNFEAKADGKAYPLPKMFQLPGHVAGKGSALSVAVGSNSNTLAEQLLAEPLTPAPFMLFTYDYSRFGDLIPAGAVDANALDIFKHLGIATIQSGIDARGLYMWMSLEMK